MRKLFPETISVHKATYDEMIDQYQKLLSYLRDPTNYSEDFVLKEIVFSEKVLAVHLGMDVKWGDKKAPE